MASKDELRQLLRAATEELGFDHFALLHHASIVAASPRLILIHSYPEEWEAELKGRQSVGSDPVHLASVRTHIGFSWSELPRMVRLGAQERQLLERARRFGIGDGFTVPVNIPGEPPASCSFAVRPGRSLPQRLRCAEQLGLHAFGVARRLHQPMSAPTRRLSPRERQCVRLVAVGKTDWEIAAILGISIETAHQYVKSARAAYGVASRAQLAACGLRDALVSYDEAIPPYG